MSVTDSTSRSIRYGLIGAGGFGRFCVEQYRSLPSVECVAVADANVDAAKQAGDELGLRAYASVEAMLEDTSEEAVDLVHIATPPFTHADLAKQALQAGKHVLCEKPLATKLSDAEELAALAAEKHLVLSVNLIMRYNPLAEAVKTIIDEQLLGLPLHGFFENNAKDEELGPDHWFWQADRSGGIFIEHGVHFFDLFQWWLGHGQVVSANGNQRASQTSSGNPIVEQVQCTVRYTDLPAQPLVNFHHGFTQANRMDRQEMRITFERGTLRLFEWVPTQIEVDAILENATLHRLKQILSNAQDEAQVETLDRYTGDERNVCSRHQHYTVDQRAIIRGTVGMDKPALYGHVVRSLLHDQIQAIFDEEHKPRRRITEANGITSLAMADQATQMMNMT